MRRQPGRYPESVINEVQTSAERTQSHTMSADTSARHGPSSSSSPSSPSPSPFRSRTRSVFKSLFTSLFAPHSINSPFSPPTLDLIGDHPIVAVHHPQKRPLKDALADLHEAARDILQSEQAAQNSSNSEPGPRKATASPSAPHTPPTDQDIDDLLSQILDTSRGLLEVQYDRWVQGGRRAGDEKSQKRKRDETDDTVAGHPVPKSQRTKAAAADRNPMTRQLYISDSEDETTCAPTLDATLESSAKSPLPLPPGQPQHQPLSWETLPDNVKLIVVKELTSWFPYSAAVRLLRLTKDQERTFRRLYNGELQKQVWFDEAIKAEVDAHIRERERRRHYPEARWQGRSRAVCGWPAVNDSRVPVASQAASSLVASPVPFSTVPPLELLTDYVTIQQMKMGQDFLVAVGFDRAWADLGHWIGHRGSGRFEIDLGHHQRVCKVGSLERQPPVWARPPVPPPAPAPAPAPAKVPTAVPDPAEATARALHSPHSNELQQIRRERKTQSKLIMGTTSPVGRPRMHVSAHEQRATTTPAPSSSGYPPQQPRRRGRPRLNPVVESDTAPVAAGRVADKKNFKGKAGVATEPSSNKKNAGSYGTSGRDRSERTATRPTKALPGSDHPPKPRREATAMSDGTRIKVVRKRADETSVRHAEPTRPPAGDHNSEEDGEYELE